MPARRYRRRVQRLRPRGCLAARAEQRVLPPYTNADVVGTEIGGACKNIIALACGMAVGIGLGENTAAAIITRGLAEIIRLGTALGANGATLAGLAGSVIWWPPAPHRVRATDRLANAWAGAKRCSRRARLVMSSKA